MNGPSCRQSRNSVSKKLSDILAPDAETANIYRGINSMVDLFKGMNRFFLLLAMPCIPHTGMKK